MSKRRGRALRRRYGRSSDTTQFKHLLLGGWFNFTNEPEWHHPWVKTTHHAYVSALAPNTGPKYRHRASGAASVRHTASYPTHAFPGGGK